MTKIRILLLVVFIAVIHSGCSGVTRASGAVDANESITIPAGSGLQSEELAAASDAPEKVHLSWTSDTSTTMTILWQTENVESGAVEYGTDPESGFLRVDLGRDSILKTGHGIIHEAALTGLSPGTLYRYRCGSDEGGWSGYYSFTTAPVDMPFKFAVLGDTQHFRNVRRKTAAMIKAEEPLFVVQCGDMVNLGGNGKQWNEWFDDMKDLVAVAPFMVVMGNHDNYCMQSNGLCPKMFEQFALPDNDVPGKKEHWYSFDVAGAHFTMLNSEKEAGIGPETDQYIWLEDDLEQNGNAEWKLAFMHKPPFSMGAHGDYEPVQKSWVPLFDSYNVDIVFSGHEHLYERTKPLRGGIPSDAGTVYIVSGSSGSVLYPLLSKFMNTPENLYETVSSSYCYIIVDVKPDQMEVKVIRSNGRNAVSIDDRNIDSFTIKNRSASPGGSIK